VAEAAIPPVDNSVGGAIQQKNDYFKKFEDLREADASSSIVLLAASPFRDSSALVVPPPQILGALQVHAAQPTIDAAGRDAV
jgi:hypothetical protein